jgi:glycogen synthase
MPEGAILAAATPGLATVFVTLARPAQKPSNNIRLLTPRYRQTTQEYHGRAAGADDADTDDLGKLAMGVKQPAAT